ncbi:hypothetical protein PV350_18850 [Streptomyces sp. PA03-6a]|nr:hypothetical protein [Streptomyces sp. PA03-6a]
MRWSPALQAPRAKQHGGEASAQLLIDEAEVIEGSWSPPNRRPGTGNGLRRWVWQQMRAAAIAVAGSTTAGLATQLGQPIGA